MGACRRWDSGGEGQSNSRLRSSHYGFHMRTNSGMHVKPIVVRIRTYIGRARDLYRSEQ